MFSETQRHQILDIARITIEQSVRSGQRILHEIKTDDEALLQPRGNFVTLMLNNNLRGCIGSIEGNGAFLSSVAEHAWSAAFRDPRFAPVKEDELDDLSVSVSVLTPKIPVEFTTEADLMAAIRPGIDGLLIQKGNCHATFLPSVWESLPDPRQFLAQLKLKAGMSPPDVPDDAWRYSAESINER